MVTLVVFAQLETGKHEERRKVSSIRIRRALPKLLHNLTPMGLPKPIRYVYLKCVMVYLCVYGKLATCIRKM